MTERELNENEKEYNKFINFSKGKKIDLIDNNENKINLIINCWILFQNGFLYLYIMFLCSTFNIILDFNSFDLIISYIIKNYLYYLQIFYYITNKFNLCNSNLPNFDIFNKILSKFSKKLNNIYIKELKIYNIKNSVN